MITMEEFVSEIECATVEDKCLVRLDKMGPIGYMLGVNLEKY